MWRCFCKKKTSNLKIQINAILYIPSFFIIQTLHDCLNRTEGTKFFWLLIGALIVDILGFIDLIFLIRPKTKWRKDLVSRCINMALGKNLSFDISSHCSFLMSRMGSCKGGWMVILTAFNIDSPSFQFRALVCNDFKSTIIFPTWTLTNAKTSGSTHHSCHILTTVFVTPVSYFFCFVWW